MFRLLLPVLYASVVSAAPQDSTLSYIKPLVVDDNPEPTKGSRETSLEELPTTVRDGLDILFNNSKPSDIDLLSISSKTQEESEGYQSSTKEYISTTPLFEPNANDVTEATERNISSDKSIDHTEANIVKARSPSPRFISKLSYYKKSDDYDRSPVANFIERTGKRKFKSKCRCEKIWNCPKLQITVPRCPNEYFLCCF